LSSFQPTQTWSFDVNQVNDKPIAELLEASPETAGKVFMQYGNIHRQCIADDIASVMNDDLDDLDDLDENMDDMMIDHISALDDDAEKTIFWGEDYAQLTVQQADQALDMLLRDQSVSPVVKQSQTKVQDTIDAIVNFCTKHNMERLVLPQTAVYQLLLDNGSDEHVARYLTQNMDQNNDGMCDFREIIVAIINDSLIRETGGTLKANARLVFDRYDLDKNGYLGKAEMMQMLIELMGSDGSNSNNQQAVNVMYGVDNKPGMLYKIYKSAFL
jgi:hypothetical protein